MKTTITFIILLFINLFSNAQTNIYDSTFYYNADGTQNKWYLQLDVFIVRM